MSIRVAGVRLVSLIMFYLLGGWAQADEPSITVKPDADTFFEKYDETIDVAGQLRAGLMYGSSLKNVKIDELVMDLSLGTVVEDERACIRVASRNGAFSATWEITLNTDINEQVITNFPTKHRTVLERFEVDQLVAIASVVTPDQKCAVSGRRYLPTSWGNPDRQKIVAYLNSDSTEVLIAGKTTEKPLKNDCRILPATDENTSFDTICTLDISEIVNNSEPKYRVPSELVVLRKNFSTVMKKISYPLTAP